MPLKLRRGFATWHANHDEGKEVQSPSLLSVFPLLDLGPGVAQRSGAVEDEGLG
jgi:hypothetical protein